jgi:hypothetical protein
VATTSKIFKRALTEENPNFKSNKRYDEEALKNLGMT